MTATPRETLDRLEHDAEQARARVSSQLAQVRHRLEPEEIKHQALEAKDRLMARARDSTSQYIEERKRRLKQTVLDAAVNNPAPALAVGTLVAWSLWGRLSRIPAPILLIGAGGLAGLMRWKDGSSPTDQRTYPAEYWEVQLEQAGPRGERTGRRLSSIGEPASQAAGRARELAHEAGLRISEASARAGSAVSDMAGRTGGEISRAAGDAATTASDLGRRAGSQFSDLLERHPLVLGGLALAIGAAIAYSFRPTETEARMLGESSDRFRRRAGAMAEEQFQRAQTVAERAYAAASDEAREQGISAEGGREATTELGRKARAVADRAQEAAREKWDAETTA
jgi:hypothetical protein